MKIGCCSFCAPPCIITISGFERIHVPSISIVTLMDFDAAQDAFNELAAVQVSLE